MPRISTIILSVLVALLLGWGCAEGDLDVSKNGGTAFDVGDNTDTPSSSNTPDANITPSEDAELSGPDNPDANEEDPPDALVADDTGDQNFSEPDADAAPLDCCTVGEVECPTESSFRECVVGTDGCGEWTAATSCPTAQSCDPDSTASPPCAGSCSSADPDYGSSCTTGLGVCEQSGTMTCVDENTLACSATPGDPEPQQCNGRDSNCDGTVDSDGICGPCVDDSYAPDNFFSENAPLLSSGMTLDDLVLCDNEDPDLTSHNWFYLGEVTQFEVHLEWDGIYGPMGLDFWTSDQANAAFGERFYLSDAGQAYSELTHSEALGGSTHVYARTYFRSADKPPAGIPYTISHLN